MCIKRNLKGLYELNALCQVLHIFHYFFFTFFRLYKLTLLFLPGMFVRSPGIETDKIGPYTAMTYR